MNTTLRCGILACACVSLACSDTHDAPVGHDRSAERALITLKVQADLWDVSSSTPRILRSDGLELKTALLPDIVVRAALRAENSPRAGVRVKHFRDSRGKLHSIGTVLDASGKPPEFVYAFENGRVRAVVSSKYEKHAGKWLKVRSKVTTFDSTGVPMLQLDVQPERGGLASINEQPSAPSDALRRIGRLFLPRDLHASITEEACLQEWLTYSAASLVLASASSALTAAVSGCATTRICLAIEPAAIKFTAALSAWNYTLDQLNACLIRDWVNDTNPTGGTRIDDGSGSGATAEDELERTKKIVEDFIADAVATGNFYCTESRDYCVYYAS